MGNGYGGRKFPRGSDEVDDEVHEFTVFDKLHPKSDKVYRMIDRLHQDFKQLNVSSRSISNGIDETLSADLSFGLF
ncbi:hypothetical protein ACFX2I_045199 [Malus domestica]